MIDFSQYRPLSFSTCLDPKRVYKDGEFKTCRCGKCAACVQSRRSHTSAMLSREIKNWKHCIFFTLTYNPYYCPSAKIVKVPGLQQWNILLLGRSKDLLKHSKYIPHSIFLNEDLKYIVEYVDNEGVVTLKETLPLDFVPYLSNPRYKDSFGILCYRDVQLWRKRFIKSYFNYVAKSCPAAFGEGYPKYRIFYCGEYGSRKYRPHFHLLFMYDDERLVENLSIFRNYVFNSWCERKRISGKHNSYEVSFFADYERFLTEYETDKNPNFSFVDTSDQSVSSYVSSYVSCGASLPSLLKLRPWCAKTVSPSGKFGSFGSMENESSEILKKVKLCFGHQTNGLNLFEFFGSSEEVYEEKYDRWSVVTVPYSNSVIRSLFCKPYGYNSTSSFNFKILLSQFSSAVSSEFREVGKQFGCPSILDFTYHRKFKQLMFNHRFSKWSKLRDCLDKNGCFALPTWLFLRNGLRCMIRENLSADQYMTLFDYFWKTLNPQIQLSRWYYEMSFFVSEGGVPLRDLLIFYDELPDYSVPYASDFYGSFGIHVPLKYGVRDSDLSILFNDYVYDLGSVYLEGMYNRQYQILFNHYKHHSRSEF